MGTSQREVREVLHQFVPRGLGPTRGDKGPRLGEALGDKRRVVETPPLGVPFFPPGLTCPAQRRLLLEQEVLLVLQLLERALQLRQLPLQMLGMGNAVLEVPKHPFLRGGQAIVHLLLLQLFHPLVGKLVKFYLVLEGGDLGLDLFQLSFYFGHHLPRSI